jgi:hypothetical protein
MEQIYAKEVMNPLPPEQYCCKRIPVTVVVRYVQHGEVKTGRVNSFFSIKYQ